MSFPIFRSDPTRKLPDEADATPGLIELFQDKLGVN